MSKRAFSNPLALAILSCLLERPMHPYEIGTILRERRKDDSVRLNYGSLYTIIQSLERHALIMAQQTERTGARPERTIYAITPEGRRELVHWLTDMVSTPIKEFTNFEAALSFLPVLGPEEALAQLAERGRRLELELAMDRGARTYADEQAVPRLFLIESEYRSMLKAAEVQWLRQLVADITTGTMPGLDIWRQFHAQRDPS